jgi:hypothetical protein
MTMERMGFFAVVEGIQGYLENVRKMQEAQEREAQALERVARQHQTASSQIQSANAKTAESAAKVGGSSGGIATLAKNLVTAAAAAASTYVSFRLLESSLETTQKLGDQVHELGLRFGITAEQGSRLIFTADQLGVGGDALSRGLGILSRNMLQVQETEDGMINAGTPAAKVLSSLGINALDSGGKIRPLNDILNDLADVFQKNLSAEQRNGVAMQLFGRSGAELIPILMQGRDGLKAWADQSDRLGNTLSQKQVDDIHQYTLAQKEFQAVIKGIEIEVATGVMPTLTELGHWFADHRDDVANFIQAAMRYLGTFATDISRGLKVINDALSFIPDNEGTIIAATVAIGAAMATAFGPASVAFIGLAGIVALLGQIESNKGLELPFGLGTLGGKKTAGSDLKELYRQKDLLNGDVTSLTAGGGIQNIINKSLLSQAQQMGGLPAVQAKIDALENVSQNADLGNSYGTPEQIAAKTAAAAKAAAGGEGANLGIDFQNLAKDAKAADDPVKALAADFVKTGEVTRKLAEALGLSAREAGQVEGVDAVIRKQEEAKDKAFAFAETLSKVAEAFRENAQVAGDIVLDLANKALEAENKASADVLGRPTRESAALDLREAQLKLQSDLVHARVDPQLEILKKKGEQIQTDTDQQVAAIEAQIKQIQSQGPRGTSIAPGVHITTGPAALGPVSDPQQQAINALKAEEAQIKQSGTDRKKGQR